MTRRPLLASFTLVLLAGAAVAQERQWTLNATEQDAYLIFGVPESDDAGISLWCTAKSDVVNVFVPETDPRLKAGKAANMILTAGRAKATFRGKTETNEEAGSTSLEVQVPISHPIIAALLSADRLKVKAGKDEQVFPLYDADLKGLLEICRKG